MSYQFNPFTGNLDQTSATAPGGSDTQVQFNDGGSLGGASGLTWNKTAQTLTVPALQNTDGTNINSFARLFIATQAGAF